MLSPIPVFLDGEYKEVKLFEESGRALEDAEFSGLGKYPVYVYPHPETITLPKYIKEVIKKIWDLFFQLNTQN